MWIDDHEWPWPHHPMRLVGSVSLRRGAAPAEARLAPDLSVTVLAFQLRPLIVEACATWCGGTATIIDGGPTVDLGDGEVGVLGDYVVHDGTRFTVEPAAGFAQRFTPAAIRPTRD
jgi:hypothetical protein